MTTAAEAPFSDLVNKPQDIVAKLMKTPNRELLLRRLDDEDLVLQLASRREEEHEVMTMMTRFFVALMRASDRSVPREMLDRTLPIVFPWVRFLPPDEVPGFLDDLIDTAKAASDVNDVAGVSRLIVAWRHTAEIHADPKLLASLSREKNGDYGAVPAPPVDDVA